MHITKEQAKKFLVVYHHLHKDNQLHNEEELLGYIEKVGCIQYDPINVLAYNSHLVMQSKVTNYRAQMLDELLYKRYELIDAWDKNLSIYNCSDDPYFQRYRLRTLRYYSKLNAQVHDAIPSLRQRMLSEGPLSSIDFKDSPMINWSWAPTKAVRAALDYMFSNGEIYVHHKVNTRKYYDLIERHALIIRDGFDFKEDEAYYNWHVTRRIGGVGLLPALKDTYGFIAIDGLKASVRRATVQRLITLGHIVEVFIEGITHPYHIRKVDVPLLESLSTYNDDQPSSKIIAGLDNLIWDRDMIEEIFDFRYRWEVYVPETKREFGYYVLPILYGYDFIGRVVMKYNRIENHLDIHQLYFEKSVTVSDLPLDALALMFKNFYEFLGSDGINVIKGAQNEKNIRQIMTLVSNL